MEENDKKPDDSNSPAKPNPNGENIIQKGSEDKGQKVASPNLSAENVIQFTRNDDEK